MPREVWLLWAAGRWSLWQQYIQIWKSASNQAWEVSQWWRCQRCCGRMSIQQTFKVTTFYVIIDQLKSALEKRIEAYSLVLQIFGVLTEYESTSDEDIDFANAITRLVVMYSKDLSSDFPSKCCQCICWIKEQRHDEIASTGSAQMMFQMLCTTKVYRAFPNTEVALRIYLSLIATTCSGKSSFSQLKRIKDVKPVVSEAGMQGAQAHPQKFWFVENPGKISENVGKNSENFGKIPENPNKIPKYLGTIPENLGKMAPNVVWLQKWRPRFAEIQGNTIFWGVTPQKRSAKAARQLFRQVCEILGKNPLHPQEFALHPQEFAPTPMRQTINNGSTTSWYTRTFPYWK